MAFSSEMALCIASWAFLVFITLIAIVLLLGYYVNKIRCKWCKSKTKLHGKTVIITGATSGIGKASALDFALRGGRILMACRNVQNARRVAEEIKEASGNKNVFDLELDTSSLQSVRDFADYVLKNEKRLDILVLNAGIGGFKDKIMTKDGLELTMATNHFGHFLLCNLLLDLLEKSKPSRIIVVASQAHYRIRTLDPKDLAFSKGKYSSIHGLYGESKLCNVMFCQHLAKLTANKGIIANSMCPGLVRTKIFEKSNLHFIKLMEFCFVPVFSKTPEEGAQTVIHLAVCEEVATTSGRFFLECKAKEANPLTKDEALVKAVWDESAALVGLQPSALPGDKKREGAKKRKK